MPKSDAESSWGHATVNTACPLDCPDSCSLEVTVENGRIANIDGSTRHAITDGYICAKVRRFDKRVYGEHRLQYAAFRQGPKGSGRFERVTWNEALNRIAARMLEIRDRTGAEAILPFSYGGSNGLLSQDTTDAELFRRFGTSRLARTVCAAPTGAANQALYGKMPGVTYTDYVHARLIVIWGANPSKSGIHLVPHVREAQRRGAKLVVIDPIRTQLARLADIHLAVRPGTDVAVALAVHRYLLENGLADAGFLAGHADGVERLRERAAPWTFERAADTAGVNPTTLADFADLYARTSPALIRCGWGLERNRNGGNGAMAVLALPTVGGKFGVRGGGCTMSNSSAFGLKAATWIRAEEPVTRLVNMNQLGRALTEFDKPPVEMLFVYNCNPVATMPDSNRVVRGLSRDDLFTVVFEQVHNDTTPYADVLLPATTFLESYDLTRAYGPISLQLASPAIDAVRESRSNVEVFSELAERLGVGTAELETEVLLRVVNTLPDGTGEKLFETGAADPPAFGRAPVQFVDVFPRTSDGKVHLFSDELDAAAPAGLYGYQQDPVTPQHPLALISPASSKTISSTLGELDDRIATLQMHPDDAVSRGLEQGDTIRVFNELGEVHCFVSITDEIRPGVVSLPKGLWRKHTLNGSTANALTPDTLTDLGGGACFSDTRVQVTKILTAELGGKALSLWA